MEDSQNLMVAPACLRNKVVAFIDREIEQARAGERRQVYISSADFMTRNTTRRVEVAAPVYDPDLRSHLEQMFRDQLRDTAKRRLQLPNGAYIREQGEPFNSQEHFCGQACAYDRVLSSRLGTTAALMISKEEYGNMVAIQNHVITSIPLKEVAGKLKTIDPKSDIITEARLLGISFGDD